MLFWNLCCILFTSLQEQEARLGVMKKRARERDEGEERREERGGREGDGRKQRRKECSVTDASGHINFFTDVQKGVRIKGACRSDDMREKAKNGELL